MITLSQRDSRWSQIKLGDSPLTVGRYGCTTTCVSMLTDYFKCFVDPGAMAKERLRFTSGGLLIWSSVNFPRMKFEKRLYSRNDAEIVKSLLRDPNRAVIFEVDYSHWVVATGKLPWTDIYTIADPWRGDRSLSTRYKRITGSAHFIKQ